MSLVFAADESASSLLLPTGMDVAWWLLTAVLLALTVMALVRVLRSRRLTATARVVWILLVLVLPPLGSIAALLVVRTSRVDDRVVVT